MSDSVDASISQLTAIAPPCLTAREATVLRLISEGQRPAVIARTLCYSESTIKQTIKMAMRRLGAKNRTHAVALALRADAI
jgi:DNA-binding CsgD family transcriptional regulator